MLNKVQLIELYQSGLSIPAVSDRTGVSKSTVRYQLLQAGVLRTRTDGVRNAALLGKLGSGMRGKSYVMPECRKRRISSARIEWARHNARGTCVKPSGYVEHTNGGHKGRSVHVVMMEQHIGRRIRPGECVHHINGIKTDNRLDNLQLMTVNEHAAHHAAENHHKRHRNQRGQFQ